MCDIYIYGAFKLSDCKWTNMYCSTVECQLSELGKNKIICTGM